MVVGMILPGSVLAQDPSSVTISRSNTSGALQNMAAPAAVTTQPMAPYAIQNKFIKFGSMRKGHIGESIQGADKTIQKVAGTGSAIVRRNFEGSSEDDNAAILGFRVVPPDTEGDVGPRHYVQWINSVSEIFDKRGNTILGTLPGQPVFPGTRGHLRSNQQRRPHCTLRRTRRPVARQSVCVGFRKFELCDVYWYFDLTGPNGWVQPVRDQFWQHLPGLP